MRAGLALLLWAGAVEAQEAPTFAEVGSLFAERCVICHSGEDAPLGLRLDSHAAVLMGSENGPVVIAGDANSPLLLRLRGKVEPRMPLDGPPFLDDAQIAMVAAWIAAGMPDGGAVQAAEAPPERPAPGEPVTWAHVRTIFLKNCVECHSDNSKMGAPPEGLRLDSLEAVLQGGERLAVLPGNVEMSEIWRRITGLSDPRMPFDGPPWLSDDDTRLLADWIAQGAPDQDGTPAAIPEGREVRLRGTMTAEDAIDGARFVIDGGTRIDDRPRTGGAAEMRGVVGADGTVRATRLRDR